jgi:arginase family enzyme
MEVFDYFDPVDFSRFDVNDKSLGKYSLGTSVESFTSKLTVSTIPSAKVILFGVPVVNGEFNPGPSSAPNLIREQLYSLATFNSNFNIADLGNLKPTGSLKGTLLAIRDVVEYFSELNIVTVIIGGSQDLTLGVCEAFVNNRFFSLSAVDAMLDIKKGVEAFHSSNYLTRIFKKLPQLFQYNLIAYQNHLVGQKLIEKTPGVTEHLRLGQLRENFFQSEPIMRNTDVLTFDLGAVKFSEAPGAIQANPNGLRGEEACQLARYAGMSERLKNFGLFGLNPDTDNNFITVKLAAEIIWYFLEGCTTRNHENLKPADSSVVYKVEIDDLDQPLVFFNEPATKRWWFEVNSVAGETQLFACSEEDYHQAAANEIPHKWLRFVQKMDGLSK